MATVLQVEFVPATLELRCIGPSPWPAFPGVPCVAYDWWQRPLDKEKVAPGPFGAIPPAGLAVRLLPH
jgi:hypothetical protein